MRENMSDKEFGMSITKEGDSLAWIKTDKIETRKLKYFREYEDALEYLRKQCLEFIGEKQ